MQINTRMSALCSLVSLVAISLSASAGEMFRDLGLDDAKAAAEREGKLLFIHTTAVWCPPCKKMERETYRDADLQTYFEQNLVAIKIDVDDQPRDSRSLGVSSIPTMIAMADGTRLDDHTGFIGASDLMSWLQGVEQRAERSGLISAADATATATDSSGLPMDDVAGRMAHAAKLAADGNARDAASTYASLWTDMPEVDRNLSAYRLTVLASSMGDLAQTDPSARASFQSIFDSVDSQVRSRPDWDTYGEWLALNARVLEDDDAINTWVSEFAGSSRGLATIRRRHAVLYPALVRTGKWDVMSNAQPKPGELVRDTTRTLAATERAIDDPAALEAVRNDLADAAAALIAALIFDNRENDAKRLAIGLDRGTPTVDTAAALKRLSETETSVADLLAGVDGSDWPASYSRVLD